MHGFGTQITSMATEIILTIERWRDEWELLEWKASDEYREMVHARLLEHEEAMKTGGKSPYFEWTKN